LGGGGGGGFLGGGGGFWGGGGGAGQSRLVRLHLSSRGSKDRGAAIEEKIGPCTKGERPLATDKQKRTGILFLGKSRSDIASEKERVLLPKSCIRPERKKRFSLERREGEKPRSIASAGKGEQEGKGSWSVARFDEKLEQPLYVRGMGPPPLRRGEKGEKEGGGSRYHLAVTTDAQRKEFFLFIGKSFLRCGPRSEGRKGEGGRRKIEEEMTCSYLYFTSSRPAGRMRLVSLLRQEKGDHGSPIP